MSNETETHGITEACEQEEFADAPFCTGPSDPAGRNFDGISPSDGCGPHGPYFEVATGTGTFSLHFDGELVDEWTVTQDQLSDLGLNTTGYQLPDDQTDVVIRRDGEVMHEIVTDAGCTEPAPEPADEQATVAQTVEPAPPPETLPVTGPSDPVTTFALVGASLLTLGTAMLRTTR